MKQNLTQSELERRSEVFIENGRQPHILAILETVGCGADFLDEGETLLRTWQAQVHQAHVLHSEQNTATEAQTAAHKAAQSEMVRLAERIRFLFGHNRPLLNRLGLRPRKSSNGSQTEADQDPAESNQAEAETDNGSTPDDGALTAETDQTDSPAAEQSHGRRSGSRRSRALAADIRLWRRMCTNYATLTEAQQAKLAGAGWSETRVAAAAELVEAVARSDNAQQLAMQAKQDQFALAHTTEKQLREWYRQATRRAKMAIDEQPAEEQSGLRRSLKL